jgi:hypothetical protein
VFLRGFRRSFKPEIAGSNPAEDTFGSQARARRQPPGVFPARMARRRLPCSTTVVRPAVNGKAAGSSPAGAALISLRAKAVSGVHARRRELARSRRFCALPSRFIALSRRSSSRRPPIHILSGPASPSFPHVLQPPGPAQDRQVHLEAGRRPPQDVLQRARLCGARAVQQFTPVAKSQGVPTSHVALSGIGAQRLQQS